MSRRNRRPRPQSSDEDYTLSGFPPTSAKPERASPLEALLIGLVAGLGAGVGGAAIAFVLLIVAPEVKAVEATTSRLDRRFDDLVRGLTAHENRLRELERRPAEPEVNW